MRANLGRDTVPEVRVRSLLHADGYRFRVNHPPVPGLRRTADIVFTRQRVAVFIDGCFWHGCPEHYISPKSNSEFWREKVRRNQERDADTNARLASAGWIVLRHWEHESADSVAMAIEAAVDRARTEP